MVFSKKILIIDDSDFFAKLISNVLTGAGYAVVRAVAGAEGLKMVREEKPDLVLLDVVMPDMSGFEICRILREADSNNLMPIIMLTSQDDQEDKLIGLELGADDYITKPFNDREMLSRIRNTLKRIDRNRMASPLTGLPGNLEIIAEISSRIEKGAKFAVIYADLDNFKAYNDVYGFAKGDQAIKLTADIITDEVRDAGDESGFVGHIGGDDFIIVSGIGCAEALCIGITTKFDLRIRELYSDGDLAAGYIYTLNRRGERVEYPIMSISLAVITNQFHDIESHLQVAQFAAEMKKAVKALPGSNYLFDRRRH